MAVVVVVVVVAVVVVVVAAAVGDTIFRFRSLGLLTVGRIHRMPQYPDKKCPDIEACLHCALITGHSISGCFDIHTFLVWILRHTHMI